MDFANLPPLCAQTSNQRRPAGPRQQPPKTPRSFESDLPGRATTPEPYAADELESEDEDNWDQETLSDARESVRGNSIDSRSSPRSLRLQSLTQLRLDIDQELKDSPTRSFAELCWTNAVDDHQGSSSNNTSPVETVVGMSLFDDAKSLEERKLSRFSTSTTDSGLKSVSYVLLNPVYFLTDDGTITDVRHVNGFRF